MRGSSGDALEPNATGMLPFTFQDTTTLTDTGTYGSGTYNVYADDQGHQVAVE